MAQVETWIRERAYAIWEIEGRPQGCERQHWEQATRDVMSRNKGVSPEPIVPAAGKSGKGLPARAKSGKARRAA